MTNDEKAKAYDEALERAKNIKSKILQSHLSTESCKAVSEYIDEIIPELRESEDEKVRKCLIAMVNVTIWDSSNLASKKACLAWLEKQKEQEHICDSAQYEEGFKTGLEIGLRKQKEQKEELVYRLNGLMQDYIKEGKDDEEKEHRFKCYKLFWDALEDASYFEQKEQKPNSTEDMPYITDERFYEREPKDSFKYKLAEYMTKCCTKKEGPYGYTYGISAETILKMAKEELIKRGELKEQKPAITSKFNVGDKIYYKGDSYNRYVIKEVCEDYYINGFGQRMDMSYTDSNFELLEHLDDVPLVAPSKPAETETIISCDGHCEECPCFNAGRKYEREENNSAVWSEEDRLILDSIIAVVEEWEDAQSDKEKAYYGATTKSDWLKSLSFQPREEVYQSAKHDLAVKFMNYLDENRPEGKMSLSNVECEDIDKAFEENDWTKIMRYYKKYQPHWKPSHEQIDAIVEALKYLPNNKDEWMILNTLVDILMKLM